jgi:NitT/TauT family transport system substrate-binding protein
MHATTISREREVQMQRAIAFGASLIGGLVMTMTVQAADLGMARIGVLKFGTVNWELDVIKQHGLDAKEGFTLEITEFANNDAADVALMGEAVDGIVEDWLWVSRQRSEGVPLTFIPYSSSVGALMVPAGGGIDSLADLEGKRLGIAGGPLDKSWLLIQAVAKDQGVDLAQVTELVYGAPPLLTEKFKSGELDAVINYWHFAARLEAEGHKRLIDVTAAQEALGVPADTPQLGYVFRETWAQEHADLVQAFARASRAAKTIMDQSDEEWERLRPLTRAEDDATLEALKRRYREGIVHSWGDEQRQAARRLYEVLAELGGEELVGSSPGLADGTFWPGVSY